MLQYLILQKILNSFEYRKIQQNTIHNTKRHINILKMLHEAGIVNKIQKKNHFLFY